MVRLIAFCYLLLITGLQSLLGSTDWSLKSLTIKNGLSSNSILSIVEDNSGFIWIGTENGLNKFDGYRISQYFKSPTDTNGLRDNAIVHLAIDKNGMMWVATRSGLCIYNPILDKIQLASLTYKIHRYLNHSSINFVFSDSRGVIWVATSGDGVFAIDIDKNTYQQYNSTLFDSAKYRISSSEISSIAETQNGDIILSTNVGKLDFIDSIRETISHIDVKSNAIGDISLRKIYVDSNNTIWVGSEMAGLFKIVTQKEQNTSKYTISEWFSNYTILDILEDESKNIIVATENDGLKIIDKASGISLYSDNPTKGQFLLSNSINSLYKDKSGIVWIGTYNQGVNYFSRNNQKFQKIEHNPLNPISLSSSSVSSILEDSNGRMLIGTDGGGLSIFNQHENTFKQLGNLINKGDSKVNVVLYIKEDSKKNIWLATYGNGLVKLNPNLSPNANYINIPNANNSLASNNIRYIHEDRAGNIWIANMEKGLDKYSPSLNQFTHFAAGYDDTTSLSSDEVSFIFEDNYGTIWVGTVLGVNEYLSKEDKFQRYYLPNGENQYLANNHILSFFIDSHWNIWFGTKNGPIRFDNQKKQFDVTSDSLSLLKDTWIFSFLEDDSNNLWMGSNVGLIKYNPLNSDIKIFKSDDGLQSNEFSSFSAWRLKTGKMLFGGPNGLNIFDPDKIKSDSISPFIVFTGFRVFNKSIVAGNLEFGTVILKKEINQTDIISLTAKQRNFSIEFAALNFISPEYVSYSYILDGYDKAWINTNASNRMATYTNLEPKEYTFRVKAANHDNIWSEERSVKLIIQPAFYETLFFKIIVIAIILICGLLYNFVRTASIRKHNIRLEKTVAERTEELKKSNVALYDQTVALNEINMLLEERQQHIEEQSYKLKVQTDKLSITSKELEESNEELRKVIKTKDKFLSILAHDLKNPFNIVINFSELLVEQYNSFTDIERRDNLGYIHKSALKVYLLLENLLEWSQAQSKTIKYTPKAINLEKMVDEVLNVIEQSALSKNIIIHKEIPNNIEVFADRHMINTVLRNFLANAIKFTNSNGNIYIKAELEKPFCRIRVIDSGVGMDEKTLSKLFKVEETFSNVGTDGERGTGLGLSICKEFVLMHKGDIGVRSTKGEGADFSFTLPLV